MASTHAFAFGFQHLVPSAFVVEFHNRLLDHYFLAADAVEIAAIEAGAAGPGWQRSGHGFTAWGLNDLGQSCPGCVPVARFYGTPGLGPNSHFYTAHAEEGAGLRSADSGWTYEKDAFHAWLPFADGTCQAFLVPVYRLYNARWMFNDSNHRYVTSTRERARMRALGWADEGTKLCALEQPVLPIKSFDVIIRLEGRILPSAQCEDESINLGSCLAVNNLVPPTSPVDLDPGTSGLFADFTGLFTGRAYADVGPLPVTAEYASQQVFAQAFGDWIGLHVTTKDRAATSLASLNPLYQFRTTPPTQGADERFFPFPGAGDTELAIRFSLKVRKLAVGDSASHAYGHPTVEFIDTRSGQHLYFTVLAYGRDEGVDYLAPDLGTGKVIVGTTFRESTPYGHTTSRTLDVLPGFEGLLEADFDFRMDRAEFQRVIDRARTINALLSSDPADYLVDNFHFNNEVVGNAEIGAAVGLFSLRLMPRR